MVEKYRPKILLVDDEPEARKEFAKILQMKGYEVLEVGTGEEALSRAKSDWPSLIILDIVLPDLPGTEVFEKLRASPITKAIPVLLLTAKPDVVENMPASYAGTDRFYEKPGRLEDLLGLVQEMLTGKSGR